MAKPNTMVLLKQAQAEIKRLQLEVVFTRRATIEFCADAAVIAAHEVFQRKGDIIAEFQESYQTWCQRIAKLVVEDSKTQAMDESYLEYSKTRIDEAVREALTDKYFLPWDERHEIKRG